jgi:membrane-bound lytic murein transglycosylase D
MLRSDVFFETPMRRMLGLPGAVLIVIAAAACSGNPRPQVSAAPPTPTPAPTPATTVTTSVEFQPADPIEALIAESDRLFALGTRELALGHLVQARDAFDRSLDVLLEAPGGARTEARVRTHFDRLVDRIAAQEALALQTGDGFTEKPSEPAVIDELLEVATFAPSMTPDKSVEAAVQADLASTLHDIPIPLNERVLKYVELFQGRLRGHLAGGLQRGTRYLPMIQQVFREEGVPLDLAYVPLIESAFKPTALSRASARGMWQFMRGTASDMGLKQDWYIDERADPEKATVGAARYLKVLYGMFSDWHLALASYNGGPGRVQRAMKASGRDDFWTLSSSTRYLPRETREYVPMILAAIIIARNPAQYGFEIEPTEPLAYDKVRVPTAVDLRRVAEWTQSSIDEIQALNPELRRWTTPVRYPDYEVKVPVGRGPELEIRLASASQLALASLRWHNVRRGESLAGIARKLGVSRKDLAEANGIRTTARVRVGQQLIIPRAPSAPLLAAAAPAAPGRVDVPVATSARGASAGEADDEGRIVYRVKPGDTLYRIAARHDVSIAEIKAWNRLRSDRLAVGTRLTLHLDRGTRAAQ